MSKISTYLRDKLSKSGHTQQYLSEKTGISPSTISRYLSPNLDDESATFCNVLKIIRELGGSMDECAGLERPASVTEDELRRDGYSQSEIRAITRWCAENINALKDSENAALKASLKDRDERLEFRMNLMKEERQRANKCMMLAFIVMGIFVSVFVVDFLVASRGWIVR